MRINDYFIYDLHKEFTYQQSPLHREIKICETIYCNSFLKNKCKGNYPE